jgi:hypothetical protein
MSVISTVLLLPLFSWGGSWPRVGGAAHRRVRRRDCPRRPGHTRPPPARSGPCPAGLPGRGEQASVPSLLWDSPADRDRHGTPVMPPSTTNTHRRHGVFRGPPVRQVGQPPGQLGARPYAAGAGDCSHTQVARTMAAAGERRRTGNPLARAPPGRPLELDDDQGVEAPEQQHRVHVYEIDREDAAARGGQDLLPGRAGRGAEPIPAARRICRTVRAVTRWPSLTRSPCTRASRKPRPRHATR